MQTVLEKTIIAGENTIGAVYAGKTSDTFMNYDTRLSTQVVNKGFKMCLSTVTSTNFSY